MKILKVLFWVLGLGLLGYGFVGGFIAEKKFEKEKLEEAKGQTGQPSSYSTTPMNQAAPGEVSVYKVQYGDAPPEDVIVIEPSPVGGNIFDWAKWIWNNWENWAGVIMLLLVAIEPIIRWTPTEKDNNLLRTIQSWLDRFVPNNKKGGGTFTAFSKPEDAPPIGYVPPAKE